MTKTAREWIEQSTLPAEVKEAALDAINRFSAIPEPLKYFRMAISVAFHWDETKEGAEYWTKIVTPVQGLVRRGE